MSRRDAAEGQKLQCMEIWGGIEPVERTVSTPGLDLWVFSQPFQGDEQGGDVYYVTLCGGGVITRIVVADVSGHGSSVAEFSLSLRALLRKNINQKSSEEAGRTAQPAVYRDGGDAAVRDGARDHLSRIPRSAVGLQRRTSAPALLPGERRTVVASSPSSAAITAECNLPLGLDEETSYQTFDLKLGPGDLVVFYTDALTEAADHSRKAARRSGVARRRTCLGPGQSEPRCHRRGPPGGRRTPSRRRLRGG